ncbi:MAG TPA: M20/M25/M40 family metallo-hydrolase [Gemmatimonadaceae bacterium]|nr:M20/M25/M40 family metallo-hydrolase [Gemmatimonadaceae bacterium]
MQTYPILRVALCAVLVMRPVTASAQGDAALHEARLAWERGDYPAALNGFERILTSPSWDRHVEPIALITGELYRTSELTTDGRAVRFSPEGKWTVFERGTAPGVWTIFVASEGAPRRDSVPGTAAVFDDVRGRMAYLRPQPGTAGPRLIVRDLASSTERVLAAESLLVASPVFSADGETLYFIGKSAGENGTHVYGAPVTSMRPSRVTSAEAARADLRLLPGGRSLLWITGADPFVAGGRGGRGGRGGGGGGGGGRGAGRGGAAQPGFVTRDLTSGAERAFAGTSPSVSADGRVVVYLERGAGETQLKLANVAEGEPVVLRRSAEPMDNPVVSADGRTVAFEFMPREDREIFLIDADGRNERRLTREIQHDLMPRWVGPTTILAMIGEARHRRSHLYDATTGTRTRLFHNNTVRTVAPEYEWVVSPDGSRIAIVAERDGDTVSPERGVYVVDLRSRVTRDDLLARVRSQRTAELALREDAKRRYGPVAAEIRSVTENVSKDQIYTWARDLFRFDSKNITQPGNARAIAYLDSVYKSFGYETELQWWEPRPGIRTANVVATLKGTVSPDAVYVVGSHFDSAVAGPGSDDNTSGTTMLLETARVLARNPQPATIRFVSFTGEESGLLGSREFVRRLKADSVLVVGAMNNDMMGYSNDQRLDNTIRYSNPGIRDVQHGAALEFSRLITYDALYYKSTDAAALFDGYGDIIGGFGSYPILGNPHYHQRHDVLETINFELMVENTKANVATMMMLALSPSRVNGLVAERAGSGVTLRWAPSPERDIRDYLIRWRDGSGAERTLRASQPRATIPSLPPGTAVMVKAVNRRGLEGWDWARATVP